MSVKITINGTVITLPSSGASPNWSPAIIEAFKQIEQALNSVSGQFDVPQQTMSITAFPSATATIDNLSFPTSRVRAATIFYSVYRQTDAIEVSEAGTLEICYNDSRPNNEKWEIVRTGEGDASISFSISDSGQVSFTTSPVSGTTTEATLAYRAISVLNETT